MTERKDSPSEKNTDKTLVIERVFDAPRHLVFAAWTQKEHLDKWCLPHGFIIPHSEGDLRQGGKWKCHMVAPDGESHHVEGVYREIIPNELLVFTHGWQQDNGKVEHETLVTVRFADEGGKTRVAFEQGVFRSVESRNGHLSGWSQGFETLDNLLAKLKTAEKKS